MSQASSNRRSHDRSSHSPDNRMLESPAVPGSVSEEAAQPVSRSWLAMSHPQAGGRWADYDRRRGEELRPRYWLPRGCVASTCDEGASSKRTRPPVREACSSRSFAENPIALRCPKFTPNTQNRSAFGHHKKVGRRFPSDLPHGGQQSLLRRAASKCSYQPEIVSNVGHFPVPIRQEEALADGDDAHALLFHYSLCSCPRCSYSKNMGRVSSSYTEEIGEGTPQWVGQTQHFPDPRK